MVFARGLVAICIGAIFGKSVREGDLYNIFSLWSLVLVMLHLLCVNEISV